ncbi:MAG TPA: hypothetical protein VIC25_01605 [Caulobacteraceae bacterium]
MNKLFLAAVGLAAMAAAAVHADPLDDAKAGLKALDQGDNAGAVRFLTSAIDSGRLTRTDQELAYVKRSEAQLAANHPRLAIADADRALNLDPADAEAKGARDRAQDLLVAAKPADTTTRQGMAQYDAAMTRYDAEKKAAESDYANQLSSYDAKIKAQDDKHAAELAAWQASVAACKAGDISQCAQSGAAQSAATGATEAPKPVPVKAEAVAQTKPKPQKKPASAAPVERPAIL